MTPRSSYAPRLLVVEHDEGVQDLLTAFLTAEGYSVSLAASPAEGCALLDKHSFQLILTDLFSTDPRDRFGAVEMLRARAGTIPVGVITGWNVEEEEIARRGFAFLARKPFDIEELFASIAACLGAPRSQEAAAPWLPRVLLVDPDALAADSLTPALVQKGYEVASAGSLDEALALLDEHCFHLILADLPSGPQSGGAAHLLLERARPTPVGVITDQGVWLDGALEQGFVFSASKSVDRRELLTLIEATIKQPMSAEQTRLAEIARRFFAAFNRGDWEELAALCDNEVACYPPANSAFASVEELRGFHAYRAYVEAATHCLPGCHIEEIMLYARPQGIAARYRVGWTALNGHPQHLSVAKLMRFRDERVHEMKLWANTDRLRPQRVPEELSSA